MGQEKTSYELTEIKTAMEVLTSLYKSKGIDIHQVTNTAVRKGMECLSGFGGRQPFDKLCKARCNQSYLAILLYIIRSGPSWSNTWRLVVGSQRRLKQTIAILEKAASALEKLDKAFEGALALGPHQFPPVSNNPSSDLKQFEGDSGIAPLTIAGALRAYIRVLRLLGTASTNAKIHSPEAFGKYLLSSYVKLRTGSYHDAEVSALISSALREEYGELAHRMWRLRNWKHLDAVSFPLELVIGLGVLLSLNT